MFKKQVLAQIFQRLFKPWTVPGWLLIGIPFLVFLVAISVALFTQYIIFFSLKSSSSLPGLILAGLIIAILLAYKFRAKRNRGVALGVTIIIGLLLVPYFSFFLGKIQLFAVDPPPLPKDFRVIEMRVTLDKVVFVTTDNREVIVQQGPTAFTLRPGATRVHVGTIDLPAGSYTGRRIYLSNVDVDVEVDLATWPYEKRGYTLAEAVAGGHFTWEGAYTEFRAAQDTYFKAVFPNGSSKNWSALDGTKFTFTMSTGAFPQPEFQAEPIYTPGFGGPDVTLDFTLTRQEAGWVVTVTPILDFPPGIGPGISPPTGTYGPPR